MLRWVILSVVVVALAAAATVAVQLGTSQSSNWALPAGTKHTGPAPKLELTGAPTHEFGSMAVQKTGNFKWPVKNVGQGDLELWMVSSTCMCTLAKFRDGKKAVVKPGETTEIELEWKTNNAIGDYSKGATIGTNDPDRPEFKLGVHGEVHPPIIVYPPMSEGVLAVGAISNDVPKQTSVAVFSPDYPNLKVLKISSSKPNLITGKTTPLKPEEATQLKAKAGYRLDIDIKPGMAQGNFRDEVIVETDHPDQPKLNLTLTGNVTGPISIVPPSLRMVTVRSKEGASGQFTLLVREGRPTTFEVTHSPKNVEVKVDPNDTPTLKGRYRVTVTVPPGTPAGLIDDEIILRTDHPKVSELKVPVNILVGAN